MSDTLKATKRALGFDCKVKLTHTYDVQSGTAWLVEAWEYSRLTQKAERVSLGYLVATHVDEVKAYAENLGCPFVSKERETLYYPHHSFYPRWTQTVQDYRRPRKSGKR